MLSLEDDGIGLTEVNKVGFIIEAVMDLGSTKGFQLMDIQTTWFQKVIIWPRSSMVITWFNAQSMDRG